MTIVLEGTSDLYAGSSSATTISDMLSISSGNLLVVLVNGYTSGGGGTVSSISDDAGNSFVKVVNSENQEFTEIWYAKNTIGQASNEVTVTYSSSIGFRYISLSEFSGIDTVSPLDQNNSNIDSVSTTIHNSGPITTTTNNQLLIGGHNSKQTENYTATTGWSDLSSNTTAIYNYMEYDIVSSINTYETACTTGTDSISVSDIASFKQAGGDISISDNITITDTFTRTSANSIIKSFDDTITITDSFSKTHIRSSKTTAKQFSDTITIADSFSTIVKRSLSKYFPETIAINDTLTIGIPKLICKYIDTKLEIEGIEYNDSQQISVERSIGDFNGTSNFSIIFDNYAGRHNDTFALNDEVVIYADVNTHTVTTKLFTGVIEDISFSGTENNERLTISGRDYGAVLQDVTIQPTIQADRDAGEVAKMVVEQNVQGLVTSNNVDVTTGTILTRISFNHKNVFDALRQLAELVGYYFYVDEDKDVHFEAKSGISSGETFNNTNVTKAKFRTDDSEVFNQVWVYGDRVLTGENDIGGVGAGSNFNLTYKPHNTRVSVGGKLEQPGGVDGMDDPAFVTNLKYVVNFNQKKIIFVSGTAAGDNVPISGPSNVSVDYEKSTPIVVFDDDDASISTYGPKTKIITDRNIKDYSEALEQATAFLGDHNTAKIQGKLNIIGVINITPGNTCVVNIPFHNVNSQTYTILNAKYTFNKENNLSCRVMDISLNKKISDFVDVMKNQLLRVKDLETGPLEGTLANLQLFTGSFGVADTNWIVSTRLIGSSFILNHPVNGILGSYTTHTLGWHAAGSYTEIQSGGTFP